MRFSPAVPFLLLSLCACDNADTTANRLYVQASTAASQASAERDPVKRYDLLQAAETDLDAITSQYPSTAAALRIAANENVGPYSRNALREALADAGATPLVCARAPTRACVLRAITASLDFMANHPADQSDAGMFHVSQAVTGWPYLALWQGIPANVFPKQADLKAMVDAAARQATIPFLISLYETQGIASAVKAITRIAQDDNAREGLISAFSMDAPAAFADRRGPTTRTDLMRMGEALYGSSIPADVVKAIDDQMCDFTRAPKNTAMIVSDCPMALVMARAAALYKVTPEAAEIYYAALPDADKQPFAKRYFQENNRRPKVRMAWLERAGLSADAGYLASTYVRTVEANQPVDPTLTKLLRAAPEPLANTPLAAAGLTPKNLCLIHAGGALQKQMPAILQNLRANPQLTDETSILADHLIVLAGHTPGIDFAPIADAIIFVISKWPSNDGRVDYHKSQVVDALTTADVDPLPILTRLMGPNPKLDYDTLLKLKRHGHADLYDKAMSNPGLLDDPSSLAAQAFYARLKPLRDAGDTKGLVDALAAVTQNQRFLAIRNIFESPDRSLPRDAVVQAVIDRFPGDMLVLQRNLSITNDFSLTPEEQTRIFTAHAAEVIELLGNKRDFGWVLYGFPKLTPEERVAAVQTIARTVPDFWIDAAGWHLLAEGQ